MPLGSKNPLPFRIGPSPTRTEQMYGALRSAQGLGNDGRSAAGPAGGLRDLWTLCVARAIARRGGTTERAVLQSWPATMTSALSTWETLLGISPGPRATLPGRQAAVQAAIAQQLDATIPGLTSALSNISPQLSILPIPYAQSRTTEPGKAFQGLPGTGAPSFFGSSSLASAGRIATAFPMFSDGCLIRAVFTATLAQPQPTQAIIQAVAQLLANTLPSYIGFSLTTITPNAGGSGPSGTGFFCDGAHGSRLDLTAIF